MATLSPATGQHRSARRVLGRAESPPISPGDQRPRAHGKHGGGEIPNFMKTCNSDGKKKVVKTKKIPV